MLRLNVFSICTLTNAFAADKANSRSSFAKCRLTLEMKMTAVLANWDGCGEQPAMSNERFWIRCTLLSALLLSSLLYRYRRTAVGDMKACTLSSLLVRHGHGVVSYFSTSSKPQAWLWPWWKIWTASETNVFMLRYCWFRTGKFLPVSSWTWWKLNKLTLSIPLMSCLCYG